MDAIRVIEQLVGRRALVEYRPRHPADVKDTWADIGEAERIVRVVDWQGENREWAREVETG
ncbi:MAG: hypothetical protein ACUVWZ_11735 [Anaerolineae bacterium]